jgi:SEC-C motif-containing protein
VKKNVDYIKATQSPARRSEINWEETESWANNSKWDHLEIVAANDNQVEFIAYYAVDGKQVRHHERSTFVQVDGKWYFDDGEIVKPGTIKRDGDKVGRNDPCPCGSGKKYKKCCLNR